VVLFTLHSGVSRDDPRVVAAADIAREHARQISEINEWWTGFDESGRDIAADFIVMGLFDDYAAVARYIKHPHHNLGVKAWQEIADWVIIDVTEDAARH